MTQDKKFSQGDSVVYPTHGVGTIKAVESQEISGFKLEVYVISFDEDRMTLRLPIAKAKTSGLRALCSQKEISSALDALKTPGKTHKIAWAKKMQEFENKMNSGEPIAIAEVVRDLHKSTSQPDPSYSEKQLFKEALMRLAREVAAIEKLEEEAAVERIESILPQEAA